MAIDADYIVTCVTNETGSTRIKNVGMRSPSATSIDTVTKAEVIRRIDVLKKVVKTAFKRNGEWQEGAKVNTVEVDGVTYLRTDKNKVKADNLDSLSTC